MSAGGDLGFSGRVIAGGRVELARGRPQGAPPMSRPVRIRMNVTALAAAIERSRGCCLPGREAAHVNEALRLWRAR